MTPKLPQLQSSVKDMQVPGGLESISAVSQRPGMGQRSQTSPTRMSSSWLAVFQSPRPVCCKSYTRSTVGQGADSESHHGTA